MCAYYMYYILQHVSCCSKYDFCISIRHRSTSSCVIALFCKCIFHLVWHSSVDSLTIFSIKLEKNWVIYNLYFKTAIPYCLKFVSFISFTSFYRFHVPLSMSQTFTRFFYIQIIHIISPNRCFCGGDRMLVGFTTYAISACHH